MLNILNTVSWSYTYQDDRNSMYTHTSFIASYVNSWKQNNNITLYLKTVIILCN